MKVLSIYGKEDMRIEQLDKPKCIPNHAVIRMKACGICGSDLTAYRGVNPTMKYPIVGIGHEGVGEIVELLDIENTHFKIGDRVVLEPYVPCLSCPMCEAGRLNNCENLKVCGVHKDGMMAEYFLHPLHLLYKIPDEMNYETATLIEPFTIGLHAITRSNLGKGENCVIFGAGTIGLLTAIGARIYGANPIIVDLIPKRLEKAKKLGITNVINSGSEDVVERLKELCGGKLPEVLLECTGAQPVLQNIHEYVAHGGRISLVGWPHDKVPINQIRIMQKELTVYASRNSNKKFQESMDYISKKLLPTEEFITEVITLDQVEHIIKKMIEEPDNYTKVITLI